MNSKYTARSFNRRVYRSIRVAAQALVDDAHYFRFWTCGDPSFDFQIGSKMARVFYHLDKHFNRLGALENPEDNCGWPREEIDRLVDRLVFIRAHAINA